MPNIPNLTNIPSNNESAPKKNFVFVKSKDKEKYQTLNTNTSSINSILGLQETESKLTNTTQSYQATNFDIFDSLPVNISNQPIQQDNFNKNIINSISDSVPIIDMTKSKNKITNVNYNRFESAI